VFRVQIDTQLVNSALRSVPDQQFEYRHGCILGKVKLPIGAVSVVVVPSFNGSHLVFSIPFKEIKGDITGKFFLSKLVSTFWGTICKQLDAIVVPKLQKYGLPRDTLSHEKVKDRAGDVGKVKISARAVNQWLAGKHPRLRTSVTGINFTPEGLEVEGEVEAG
jgi:hypothetical protein